MTMKMVGVFVSGVACCGLLAFGVIEGPNFTTYDYYVSFDTTTIKCGNDEIRLRRDGDRINYTTTWGDSGSGVIYCDHCTIVGCDGEYNIQFSDTFGATIEDNKGNTYHVPPNSFTPSVFDLPRR
ncbi:MAG: hypothetical protein MJ025_05290 [Victivallaceae bacterium]|nr:hypothetical protein [Victivallaceae bacterium]